ncbi:ferredoxin-type protein NapF [Aliarcobacter skirrowii]|uniref:ferredoxin-type protein NapF n=1 Tax=Aliarcobacter skirrowii TaxID=28200 RepID=UPI0029B8DEF5|nr:ferredoxin-type protein NapF [Aliarcobacter skirrowii]MDX4062954.1 ferredoxin-type protein NapF [Aliarcobacter skirrowii]MDX4064749.1 ferredoxin-type protein NapF [Aliarcobacter skirrowii]MDX4066561.1 ferredoxin-type protein NapF [Aliarcobacter skirrowii]MDX4070453.1 ferredoxin-type protein NapF [Aliarcobacter skirrowii]
MNRRELFSSLAKPFKKEQESIIRPPYYKNRDIFFTNCIKCLEKSCSEACEENIIYILEDQTPSLNFSNSGCTYCDLCAKACKMEVLDIKYKSNIDAKIQIDTKTCLSWNQTMCFSCKDPCLENAISFEGIFKPIINDNCTSCGFCIKVCPTNSIKVLNV